MLLERVEDRSDGSGAPSAHSELPCTDGEGVALVHEEVGVGVSVVHDWFGDVMFADGGEALDIEVMGVPIFQFVLRGVLVGVVSDSSRLWLEWLLLTLLSSGLEWLLLSSSCLFGRARSLPNLRHMGRPCCLPPLLGAPAGPRRSRTTSLRS